jgi:transcription initiation factor TFIIIB Brf1 subunit/transcription initiation factor TFIIB
LIDENLRQKIHDLIHEYGENGIAQATLWKRIGLTSREGSRYAASLEVDGKITRTRVLEDGHFTYRLVWKKPPKSVSDFLEIKISDGFTAPQSVGEGGLTKAYQWHKNDSTRTSRALLERELDELTQIISKLGLKTQQEPLAQLAHSTFKKVSSAGFCRGRDTEAVTAAVIYAACRSLSVAVGLNDICSLSNANEHVVHKCYREMLQRGLVTPSSVQYSLHLRKVWTKLEKPDLTISVWPEALTILNKAQSIGFTRGRHPDSVAAASIYIASLSHGHPLNQIEIAKAAGITEVTLRNNYSKLMPLL